MKIPLPSTPKRPCHAAEQFTTESITSPFPQNYFPQSNLPLKRWGFGLWLPRNTFSVHNLVLLFGDVLVDGCRLATWVLHRTGPRPPYVIMGDNHRTVFLDLLDDSMVVVPTEHIPQASRLYPTRCPLRLLRPGALMVTLALWWLQPSSFWGWHPSRRWCARRPRAVVALGHYPAWRCWLRRIRNTPG